MNLISLPRRERCADCEGGARNGVASATVLGRDLTHEYVSENADYRAELRRHSGEREG